MKKSLFVAAVLAGVAGPALSHHSHAPFDPAKVVVLKGTVTSFSYLNPHSWIGITAAVDGKGPEERWDVETVAPGSLRRMGITAETLKPGDKVTVAVRPLRDGRRGGAMIYVTKEDGTSFGADPKQVEFPAP